jgi:transposase-like protein
MEMSEAGARTSRRCRVDGRVEGRVEGLGVCAVRERAACKGSGWRSALGARNCTRGVALGPPTPHGDAAPGRCRRHRCGDYAVEFLSSSSGSEERAMSVLDAPYFNDEEAAFAKLENIVWPSGPICPHCGATDRIYSLKGVRSKPSKKNPNGLVRHGLKKCGHCRQQFTARVGTVFESSHLPLHLWLQAAHLLCSSKKGISSHRLHRVLTVTYQAAWFASHRLREAMRSGALAPMGGKGGSGSVLATLSSGLPLIDRKLHRGVRLRQS